jgi:ribosomal protein S18 acetylase RimI-like enzyme
VTPLASVDALYAQLDQARRAGARLTNFYPVPDKLERSIARGDLFAQPVGDVLFVLRRDRDFLHLAFLAHATADLAAALPAVVASADRALTVDLLAPHDRVAELAAPFTQADEAGLCTLDRMTKLTKVTAPGDTPAAAPDPEVELAQPGDGAALARMLEAALDRHAEQIPDDDEMTRAAAAGVSRRLAGDALAGLLFYEVTGQSSLLRHWLVDPAHRDQRVGARLMRRYFADCNDVRRFLLWVISDNHNAIDRYRHYGYQADGLVDQVLIRRPS